MAMLYPNLCYKEVHCKGTAMHFHHSMFNKPFHISCKVHYFCHSSRTTNQDPGHTAWPSVSQECSIYQHVSHHCSSHSDGTLKYNNIHVFIQQVKTLDTQLGLQCPRSVVYTCMYDTTVLPTLMAR